MTPEIWDDIRIRLSNVRGDMVVQWQGDLDDHAVEQSISMVGLALQQWDQARPADPPEQPAILDVQSVPLGGPS